MTQDKPFSPFISLALEVIGDVHLSRSKPIGKRGNYEKRRYNKCAKYNTDFLPISAGMETY